MTKRTCVLALALTAVAASFGASAAASTDTATTTAAAKLSAMGVPVFDCYHLNFAWGFSMSGVVIDGDGQVFTYRKTKPAWIPHVTVEAGARYISEADIAAKFVDRKARGVIPKSTLADEMAKINDAARGRIELHDTGTRDAGSSTCHAYIHEADKVRYRDIEIGSDGGVTDSRSVNESEAAQALLTWLKSLQVAR